MRLAVALLVLALPSVASARPSAERATTLASYCSPSGDVCYGLIRRNGVVRAELTTAAHYFNRYTLCVRPPGSVGVGVDLPGGGLRPSWAVMTDENTKSPRRQPLGMGSR